jgi:hypothetical protein
MRKKRENVVIINVECVVTASTGASSPCGACTRYPVRRSVSSASFFDHETSLRHVVAAASPEISDTDGVSEKTCSAPTDSGQGSHGTNSDCERCRPATLLLLASRRGAVNLRP